MLDKLPAELVDEVIGQLDTPRDLAALSATCQVFKQRVSPAPDLELGPLQCCYLSITINNADAFRQLADKGRLARSIRHLHLVDPPPLEDYPSENAPLRYWRAHAAQGHLNREYDPILINAALKEMSNLCFLCTDGLKLKGDGNVAHIFRSVPDRCRSLTDLFLDLSIEEGIKLTKTHFAPASISPAARLRSFRGNFSDWANVPENVWNSFSCAVFTSIAAVCTSLEHLGLTWVEYTLNELFKCTFPRLRSLDIACDIGWVIHSDALHLFLKHNSSLESIHFCCIAPTFLLQDALPNLKRLKLCPDGGAMWDVVNPLSDGSYRPLEWVDFGTVRPENMSTVVFPKIAAFASTIRVVRVHRLWTLEEVARLGSLLPNVHTLGYTHLPSRPGKVNYITPMYLQMLAFSYPNLRCLKSFFLEHPASPMSPGMAVQRLGELLPRLICVDNWVRGDPRVGAGTGPGDTGEWKVDYKRSPMMYWPNFHLRNDEPVRLPEDGLDPGMFQRWG
ncbi:hypothetical protein DACRYDRAFT_119673 [Dacryopinax primogenitus]|uniref:F-box domain-containing protein n=1 Tax=Dacryopinax primogenitus (strain DJM 731) TaxID=1858805 RepID=M5FV88_DACPD|nr:uncharacterized protein DACRYDRAFT_119673 [Dacryopinax primogenitus]EJT97221.1 hypothetical protein DACRYDRAFT_119673 [Dacryopinax primogenitus]